MIRVRSKSSIFWDSIPRESGDDPAITMTIGCPKMYSPRERG